MDSALFSLLPLFGVVALGLIVGKIRLGGVALDNAAVIFVGLVFGHFGVVIPQIFQTLGLIFFVVSVALQSGSGFLSSFGKNGLRFIGPTLLIVALSIGVLISLENVFHLDPRLALGLFTGGRSSNSGLAVAVQSTASSLPSLGHSLAYPLAILGILVFVRLLPVFFRADVLAEEKAVLARRHLEHPPLLTKTYLVENPQVVGKRLRQLPIARMTGVNLSRILHAGEILVPNSDLVLAQGDLVKAVGSEADLENLGLLLGPETQAEHFVDVPLDQKHDAQWLVVTNKSVVNQPLDRLAFLAQNGATVTRLQRNGVEISPHGTTVLRYADQLMVVAGRSQIPVLRSQIGDLKRTVDQDFLPLFLIISVGLLLGSLSWPVTKTFSFSLGLTGGVLIAGLVLSSLGKTGPILWVVSETSTRFVRQLGLVVFLASVGTSAGHNILATLANNGLELVTTALAVSLIPLAVTALVCRYGLKMDILTMMGLLSGATTCSPALGMVGGFTKSNLPNVAYATAFPFAMITMMVCTQILALFT